MSSELMNPPKRYSLCLDTLQEPGSAKCAGRRRMGRNCCTRKPIRSNVDMQSQSEGPEISSNKECKCAKVSETENLVEINTMVLTKLIAKIWEHGTIAEKKFNGARITIYKTNPQVSITVKLLPKLSFIIIYRLILWFSSDLPLLCFSRSVLS